MKVLLADERQQKQASAHPEPARVWAILAATGAAVMAVGWTDLGLLWFPLRFGTEEWEFGTISAHLNGMPLGTVGLALLAAGAIGRGWPRVVRALGVVCVLTVLALIGMFGVYLLDVPIALAQTPPEAKPIVLKAILKATVFVVVYVTLYAWLAFMLLRHSRSRS